MSSSLLPLKTHRAEGRCALNMSRLKYPPFSVAWKFGDGVGASSVVVLATSPRFKIAISFAKNSLVPEWNEKVSNHGSIPITIDCNVVAFIVFEEGFHQPIKRPKQSVFLDVTVFRHALVD
ncbi:hypothetical protein TNCV_2611281 [Trichonephila clavipes]|nr:hypothetical protein TNCV_2611281 [Trichonephila clavipes]